MLYIIVKLYPGRTEEQKISLAEQITKDVVIIAKSPEEAVFVAIEEVAPEKWNKEVHEPYILNNESNLYKKSTKTLIK
jgi:4-oxalocrotonate tautomerase